MKMEVSYVDTDNIIKTVSLVSEYGFSQKKIKEELNKRFNNVLSVDVSRGETTIFLEKEDTQLKTLLFFESGQKN